jgi:hypothetical protein
MGRTITMHPILPEGRFARERWRPTGIAVEYQSHLAQSALSCVAGGGVTSRLTVAIWPKLGEFMVSL